MIKVQAIAILVLMFSNFLCAQDTVRVRRSGTDDDRYCSLQICLKKECYTDTLPIQFFAGDKKPELRINDACALKAKSDIFVSSFEVSAEADQIHRSSIAQSSFFTGPQLKILSRLKTGESFEIANVIVHAPDGFRKMENIKIFIK